MSKIHSQKNGKKLTMEPVEFKAKDIEEGKADLGQALLRAIEEKVERIQIR